MSDISMRPSDAAHTLTSPYHDMGNGTYVPVVYLAPGSTTTDTSYATHTPAQYAVTITTTAQSLATLIGTSIPAWATLVRIVPKDAGVVYYRTDGTTATAANGMPIQQLQPWDIPTAGALAALSLISSASITAVVEFRG